MIISVFPLPWDPPRWVTRPMFFLLAGCLPSPPLCHSFETVSLKQLLSPHAKKMKNVRLTGGRTTTSDNETLHNFSPTFRRISFFLHLPVGVIAYVYFRDELNQIQSWDTSTAPAVTPAPPPATQLNVFSKNANASVNFHLLRNRFVRFKIIGI